MDDVGTYALQPICGVCKTGLCQLAQRDRLHYPFRVATGYQDFVDKFGQKLTADVCDEITVAAEHVLERIDGLEEEQARHGSVRRCTEAMKYVIQRCKELTAASKARR